MEDWERIEPKNREREKERAVKMTRGCAGSIDQIIVLTKEFCAHGCNQCAFFL